MRDEGEGAPVVKVQSPLAKGASQCGKRGQKRISETVDGPGLVGNQIPTASEEDLQFSELFFASGEFLEIRPHPCLVSDDVSIAGIGFGLSPIGVAGAVHCEAGDVENSLFSLPQQSQQKSRPASGLVDSPDDLTSGTSEGERFVNEIEEVGLLISDLSVEQLFSRSVEYVSPMRLFSSVDSSPDAIHEYLHRTVANNNSPVDDPADGSLCSEFLSSPISMSGQGLQRDRGAIPLKPSEGGVDTAILGPYGRHPDTVTGQHTK